MTVFSIHVLFLTHIKITSHIPYSDLEMDHNSITKTNCNLEEGVSFL